MMIWRNMNKKNESEYWNMFEIGMCTYSGFEKRLTSICQYLTLFVPIKSTRRNANSITSKYT